MNKIFKEISRIMLTCDQCFSINTYPSDKSLIFLIYEVEVPILVDLKTRKITLECEMYDYELSSEMLKELSQIMDVIQENLDELANLF